MKPRSLLAAGVIAAVALAAPVAAPAALPFRAIQDDETLAGAPDRADIYRQFANLRASVTRIDVKWSDVATKPPADANNPDDPAYDWFKYDELVRLAGQYGLKVHMPIYGAPAWENGPLPDNQIAKEPAKASDYASFVGAAMKHFASVAPGVVTYVEIWNEPNGRLFFGDQLKKPIAPVRYADLVQASYVAVKAATPRVKVLAGSLAPHGRKGDRGVTTPFSFLQKMKTSKGATPKYDLLSVHSYSLSPFGKIWKGANKQGEDADFGSFPTFYAKATKLTKKKIYLTEFAWITTRSAAARFAVSPKVAALSISKSADLLGTFKKVVGFMQYQLRDQPKGFKDGAQVNWQSGLQTDKGVVKPGEAAFRDVYQGLAPGEKPPISNLAPVPVAGTNGVASPNGDGVLDGAIQVKLTFARRTKGSAVLLSPTNRVVATLLKKGTYSGTKTLTVDPAPLTDGVYRVRATAAQLPVKVRTITIKNKKKTTTVKTVKRRDYLRFSSLRIDRAGPDVADRQIVFPATIVRGGNPADDKTSLGLGAPEQGTYSAGIFQNTGAGLVLVKTLLAPTKVQNPGGSLLTWDGTNDAGQPVAAGTYSYTVAAVDLYGNRTVSSKDVAVQG